MADGTNIKDFMIHTKWYVGFPMPDDWMQKHIAAVKEHYNNCIKCKDWLGAIFIVERPYRAQELCNLLPYMSSKEKWEAIKEVYIDSENPSINYDFWKLCFTLDDLKDFYDESKKDLSDTLKIYRGMSIKEYKSKKRGFSWTLSKEKAEFFAHRFKRNGVVEELDVNKNDVVCFLPDRKEQEVIYFVGG